ncbi:rCG44143 [Rattus norvegicus]|uniref:RCG44143 n=1 Tax=Rattus norvegicus TaxID=10116 RepID=A6J7P1_RAT|nr:rCG44143 [Rattus norvegicus]
MPVCCMQASWLPTLQQNNCTNSSAPIPPTESPGARVALALLCRKGT